MDLAATNFTGRTHDNSASPRQFDVGLPQITASSKRKRSKQPKMGEMFHQEESVKDPIKETSRGEEAARRESILDASTGTSEESDSDMEAFLVRDVVDEFAGGASMHGLNYVFDRTQFRLWKRFIWFVLVCGGLGLTVWQISALVTEYHSYDVATSVQTIVPPALSFPAVTVCNTNPIRDSKVKASGLERFPENEEELYLVSSTFEETIPAYGFNEKFYADGDQGYGRLWNPVLTFFGVCFQFETDEKVFQPGYYGGLELIVDLEQYDTSTSVAVVPEAGLRVFIHQRNTTINEQSKSINASPGLASRVTINSVKFERERDLPWANCFSQAPEYTQTQCRADCFDNATRQLCNCRRLGDTTPGVPDCTITTANCPHFPNVTEVLSGFCGDRNCSKPPCSEELYPASLSTLAISETTKADLVQTYLSEQLPDWNATEQKDDTDLLQVGSTLIQNNLLIVHVNFDSIRRELLTESKGMSFTQLLANMGGQLGLFLGISVVSIMELFGELCVFRLLPRLWGDRRLRGVGSIP